LVDSSVSELKFFGSWTPVCSSNNGTVHVLCLSSSMVVLKFVCFKDFGGVGPSKIVCTDEIPFGFDFVMCSPKELSRSVVIESGLSTLGDFLNIVLIKVG
jgi:hypothetical protein